MGCKAPNIKPAGIIKPEPPPMPPRARPNIICVGIVPGSPADIAFLKEVERLQKKIIKQFGTPNSYAV